MEPGDKELVANWLDDFEAKAKRMAGDSFGVAGVGRDLEVIAALRRLLPDLPKPGATGGRWIDMPHVSMEDAAAFAASLRKPPQT